MRRRKGGLIGEPASRNSPILIAVSAATLSLIGLAALLFAAPRAVAITWHALAAVVLGPAALLTAALLTTLLLTALATLSLITLIPGHGDSLRPASGPDPSSVGV